MQLELLNTKPQTTEVTSTQNQPDILRELSAKIGQSSQSSTDVGSLEVRNLLTGLDADLRLLEHEVKVARNGSNLEQGRQAFLDFTEIFQLRSEEFALRYSAGKQHLSRLERLADLGARAENVQELGLIAKLLRSEYQEMLFSNRIVSWHDDRVRLFELKVAAMGLCGQSFLRLQEVCSSLKIDTSLSIPQNGFGREVSALELYRLAGENNAKIFVVSIGDIKIGLNVLLTDLKALPTDVKSDLVKVFGSEAAIPADCAWSYLIGLSKNGREFLRQHGINGYDILHQAVVNQATQLGRSVIYGQVREGPQGNLAKESHLRRGWRETGQFVQHGEFPYQILELLVRPKDGAHLPTTPRNIT